MKMWWIISAAVVIAAPSFAEKVRAPAYHVTAQIAADGTLENDVTIVLPVAMTQSDRGFLLGRRFHRLAVDAGDDATVSVVPVEEPIGATDKIVFHFKPGLDHDVRLHFRYRGPLNPADDDGVPAFRPDGWEIFLDHLWIPIGADLQTRFTDDTRIEGVPDGFVVVAQGKVTRTPHGVHIVRKSIDIDLPLVAAPGLKRAAAPGVEFYARDLTTAHSTLYLGHALAASAYLQGWFGPLRDPVRLVMVVRKRPLGYARAGYIVVSETERPATEAGSNDPRIVEASSARHVAHEFAHAWWNSASPLTEDFWLVESMAEYCALRYVDQKLGPAAAEALYDVKRKDTVTAGPVMGHGRPNKVQLYQKGPLLLHDLEQRIGRDKMDRLLRELAPQGPHTTAMFLAALTRIAGADAAQQFAAALHS